MVGLSSIMKRGIRIRIRQEQEPGVRFLVPSMPETTLRMSLRSLASGRSFGKELSKSFQPGKPRKDCLPRLLAALAALSTERIRTAISEAASYSDREGAEPYRRLASHIISGA